MWVQDLDINKENSVIILKGSSEKNEFVYFINCLLFPDYRDDDTTE